MENDYKKYQFWMKKINNKKIYYIKIRNQWIKVNKEVYTVCRNSYQKINYEIKKDINNPRYSDINHIDLYGYFHDYDYIDKIYQDDIQIKLYKVLNELDEEELYIMKCIYFYDKKEIEVSKKLGISQQRLNYQKKRILKKLRKILLKHI
ncbi:sigma-70 family RNA polymerase sigma factor [Thomasclavelia ramosa]|uniref:sigma-70 family RNA polymerase sigma factor n=1 Tax=Thomasclavelia ramosa TaxID=1547 RepID=UPI0032C06B08